MNKYFTSLLEKYSSLFKENFPDAWSMMRYISWFIVTDIMFVWTYLCLKDHKFLDIPMGVVAILGLAIGGKVLQKSKETITTETTDKT